MSESYTPKEILDAINSQNPDGVKIDLFGTDELERSLESAQAKKGDIFAGAKREIVIEKEDARQAEKEAKIAEVEKQIQAMKNCLRDWQQKFEEEYGYYPDPNYIERLFAEISVEYNEEKGEAFLKGSLSVPFKEARGLIFPKHIVGDINLSGLESAEDLELPESIEGSLDLSFIVSAKDLKFPNSISENLNLYYLSTIEGLILPQHIGGTITFANLSWQDKDALRQQRPDLRYKFL